MSATILDIVEGAVTETYEGIEAVRIARVSGLEGPAYSRCYNALLASGIPSIGAVHDGIPLIQLVSRSAEIEDATICKVTLSYRKISGIANIPDDTVKPQITVTSSVVQTETNHDINGVQMSVSHTFTDDAGDGTTTTRTEEQGGSVSVYIPQSIFQLVRREPNDASRKAREFVGKVNGANFFGDDPRTWLCTNLSCQSDDGGRSYNVTYEFQRADATWDATVRFKDPATNQPPVGLVEGTGIKNYIVYESADFSALNVEHGYGR